MSSETTTFWSCDRCGDQTKGWGSMWQPNDWATLTESSPPKAAQTGTAFVAHLCRRCRDSFRDWMQKAGS